MAGRGPGPGPVHGLAEVHPGAPGRGRGCGAAGSGGVTGAVRAADQPGAGRRAGAAVVRGVRGRGAARGAGADLRARPQPRSTGGGDGRRRRPVLPASSRAPAEGAGRRRRPGGRHRARDDVHRMPQRAGPPGRAATRTGGAAARGRQPGCAEATFICCRTRGRWAASTRVRTCTHAGGRIRTGTGRSSGTRGHLPPGASLGITQFERRRKKAKGGETA